MKTEGTVYALVGLGMLLVGIPVFLLGIVAMLGVLVATMFNGLLSGSIVNLINVLGIGAVIGGAVGTYAGLYLVNKNGGKFFRLVMGLIALIFALVSAILALLTVSTIIGLFVFLMVMILFLIIADWGFNSDMFTTKFIGAIPIVGRAVVNVTMRLLPKK